MDELFEFLNTYPFMWACYPILLVLPVALIVGWIVTHFRGRDKEVEEPKKATENQSDNVPPTNNIKKSPRSVKANNKTADEDQQKPSDGKKDRVRYIVRNQRSEDDSAVEIGQTVENEPIDDSEQWRFPPSLEDFNLMDLDDEVDPSLIENKLNDERLIQIIVRLSSGQGLGLSIVGGKDSNSGEAPIYIKRILGDSVFQKEGKLKAGDELVAVNDIILIGSTKDHALEVLNSVEGSVRLLVIQDL